MARIDFAWELGGGTGHVTTLLPVARALKARGHDVRFFLKVQATGGDLEGMAEFAREPAPHWVGPAACQSPLNFGEILHNFGYQHPEGLRQLVQAWRERMAGASLVVANVAPAAHLAARTLGIPSLEISQGFHIPPPSMPAPPLRDWEPAPRGRLEEADRSVLGAMNQVLESFGAAQVNAIGELFSGRALLLTYPELDIYPQRGPADYYGLPATGEGAATPAWPGTGAPRIFSYAYSYYKALPALLRWLAETGAPTLMLCRGIDASLKRGFGGGSVFISEEAMAVSRLLPECDMVLCHGSHQMTAQALLAGKPVLLLPTQLEQFLITRRVVRYGAGLGIAPEVEAPDFAAALRELVSNPGYGAKAREFAERYRSHDREAALATMVQRCEAALG